MPIWSMPPWRRKQSGTTAPPVAVWLERSATHIADRSYDDAERVLEDGLAALPDALPLLAARARLEGRRGRWHEAAARWADLVTERGNDLNVRGWTSAAHSHRRAGDLTAAEQVLSTALERWPRNRIVLWEAAHVAMARSDWDAAANRWVRYWRAQMRGAATRRRSLPLRSPVADWHEAAWHEVADHLDSGTASLRRPTGPGFHLALARTLSAAEFDRDAMQVLERGIALHPDDAALTYALAASQLTAGTPAAGLPISPGEIARVLDSLPSYTPPEAGAIGPIRLIRVPEHSSIALALRAGHHVDRAAVRRLVLEVSERDQWPERLSEEDVLVATARRWSEEFGRRFAAPPHLPAQTLADALVVSVFHEATLFVPMQRLATELADRADGAPIVIEVPGTEMSFLQGYAASNFDLAYLYFALLERGANAFLCVVEADSVDSAPTTFEFTPQWTSMVATLAVAPDPAPHSRAVVPAGIRRVKPLVDELDDVVVYQSGAVVKEFAYDRSIHQDHPVVATARLHPEHDLLPEFRFPLRRVMDLPGHTLTAHEPAPRHGAVEVSEPLGGTWAEWLHRATSPLLDHLARTAASDIEHRGISEVHVSDHLHVENVIVGDAVRRAGGRVVLWPHSTNPVHTDLRRPGSFDEVHAVTRGGAEAWRRSFPGVAVHHSSHAMLTQSAPRDFEPDQPISVVVFGGRSVLGSMPVLDTRAHGDLYRRFFAALEALQRTHPIDVHFKSRGQASENEQWLFNTVGNTAAWQPVVQHATRLELPNRIYASVSLGTSALIEGLSQGVPGFIVREFPVRDYTTLDAATFPIVETDAAIDLVARATRAEGYLALRDREFHQMREELGFT